MVPPMNEQTVLLAAGGDERSAGLCRLLTEHCPCRAYSLGLYDIPGVSSLARAEDLPLSPDILLLPLPLSRDGLHPLSPLYQGEMPLLCHLLDLCHEKSRVYCGKADEFFRKECINRKLILTDYLDDEVFTVKNAAATAEAAIVLLLSLRKRSLFGTRVLLLGGGRIAKNLIRLLNACGARVICAARSPEQRLWAGLIGALAVPFDAIPDTERIDIVISTVPRMVFGETELEQLRKDCLLIELGSPPGGIDEKAAGKQGRQLVRALSLPGKTVPDSVSEWLAELVLEKEAAICENS